MAYWKDSTAKSNAKTLPRKCPSALMALGPTQRPKLHLRPQHQPHFPPQPQNLTQLVLITPPQPHPAGSCEPFSLPIIPFCQTTTWVAGGVVSAANSKDQPRSFVHWVPTNVRPVGALSHGRLPWCVGVNGLLSVAERLSVTGMLRIQILQHEKILIHFDMILNLFTYYQLINPF